MKNELAVQQKSPFALAPEEIFFLGEKGICKYKDGNILEAISVTVSLSLAKGHMYFQSQSKKYLITAEGQEYLNKFTNLQQIDEPEIILDGTTYSNPYIAFDKNGKKSKVYQKCTLIGRDTNGDVKTSTVIVITDAEDLLMSEISNKLKYDHKQELGYYSTHDEFLEDKEKERGLKYIPIDDDYGIVVKLKSEDFRKIKANVDDKRATIERKTQTVAKRNAFRKHPATSIYTLVPKTIKDEHGGEVDKVHKVQVIKWLNGNDSDMLEAIEKYREHAASGSTIEDTEKYSDLEETGFDDEEGIPVEDIEIIEDDIPGEVNESAVESKLAAEDDAEREVLVNQISEAEDIFGVELIMAIFEEDKLDIDTANITELKAVLHKINSKVDGGNQNEDN